MGGRRKGKDPNHGNSTMVKMRRFMVQVKRNTIEHKRERNMFLDEKVGNDKIQRVGPDYPFQPVDAVSDQFDKTFLSNRKG